MDAAGEGVTCLLDSLPDFLLARIMVLTGWEHRRSMVLVSSRWRRVCKPSLWRTSANTLVQDQNGNLVRAYVMGAKKAAHALQQAQ